MIVPSPEYPKTLNLYARCTETHKCGPEFGFRMEEVGLIDRWLVLEKLDGMNMRVIWTPETMQEGKIEVYGRTDRANIPGDLRDSIDQWATEENLRACFKRSDSEVELPSQVVLFGEGIGKGIQGAAGAAYGAKQFVLFDVLVNSYWLRWDDVKDVAEKLGIEYVSELGRDLPLEQAERRVRWSAFLGNGHPEVEGIILRTDPYLFDQRGRRVMAKYKVRDL